jgi:hypothetical protein
MRLFNLKSSLLVNLTVGLIFWVIFFPGFYSSDSFGVLEMVESGNLNSSHTALYALYVDLLSLGGRFPAVVTLANMTLLIVATTLAAWRLPFTEHTRFFSALGICLTPLVWGMSLTFWHDIPFTAGLIFLMLYLTAPNKSKLTQVLLVLGALLSSFRPNGLPTILIVLLIVIASKRLRIYSRPVLVTLLVSILSSSITSNAIDSPVIVEHFGQEWMRNDVSCAVAQGASESTIRSLKESGTNPNAWSSIEACTFLNRAEVLRYKEFPESYEYIPKVWLDLAISKPFFVFRTHLDRNYYLSPIPYKGLRGLPFLHTNIEFESKEIKWQFPNIAQQVRNFARAWNYLGGVLAHAGIWLLFLTILAWRTKNELFKVQIMFLIPLASILFVVAPIPDARYALPILILGQLSALSVLVEKLSKSLKSSTKSLTK